MTDQPAADDPSTEDAEAEIERLRRRVAVLESELGTTAAHPPHDRQRWRAVVSVILIVLGCLLAPLSVVSVWASNEVSDTDRYVQTVAPLAENPAVQAAITDEITERIFTYIDVESITKQTIDVLARQGLSPEVSSALQGLSTPIAGAVENFTRDQVAKVVASPEFARLWEEANRVAHDQLVALLSGKQQGAVVAAGDSVTLNLKPFIAQAKQRLIDEGFSVASNIPEVDASFVLVQSETITKAQLAYRVLNALGTWLPFVVLLLLGAGIYAARSRRRAFIGAGLGVAASMLVLALALAVGRVFYLDSVPTDVLPGPAASAVFDTLVAFLRDGLRAVLIAGLIVAAGAFLTGGTEAAVTVRTVLRKGIDRLRGTAESAGMDVGPVGTWVYTYRQWLRVALVVVAMLALVFWPSPTGGDVVLVTVLVLIGLAVVEFLAKAPASASVAPPE